MFNPSVAIAVFEKQLIKPGLDLLLFLSILLTYSWHMLHCVCVYTYTYVHIYLYVNAPTLYVYSQLSFDDCIHCVSNTIYVLFFVFSFWVVTWLGPLQALSSRTLPTLRPQAITAFLAIWTHALLVAYI